MGSPADVIKQLNSARELCLKDTAIYPQVVPGVLPLIGASAHIELRRWGSDFLAETFASPVVNADEKQKLSLLVLDTIRVYLGRQELHNEEEDPSVVKSAVQCAASIYPLIFRHTISNSSDSETWAKMAGIKSSILRRMDTASAGVRICCIKFVARVVQVQTPGVISDPRRPDQNELSLALVPRDHAVMPPTNLEAEASGLLDRLLGVLQDNQSDALIVTATLNALSTLVQRRATISAKILTTVLSFNPFLLASPKMDGKAKVTVKSMTRTTMSFLLNVLKRNPNHALAGRIQHQVEALRHRLTEIFMPANELKRSAEDEPTDGLDDAKRRRIDEQTMDGTTPPLFRPMAYPPLPPGPLTYAQLFTLSNDPKAAGFHVEVIPVHIVNQLIPPLLASIDVARLTHAISAVQARYLSLGKRPAASAGDAARAITGEEDDEYDPSAGFGGAQEQVMNRLDQLPPEGFDDRLAIGPFNMPPPPPLSESERDEYSKTAMTRVFSTLDELDQEARAKGATKKSEEPKGFHRLAASSHEREGWITLVTRLATRASFDLEGDIVKRENDDRTVVKKGQHFDLARGIREALRNYFLADWRRRIDVAISWLNEEWYADTILQKESAQSTVLDLPHYDHYSLSLLESITPFLDDAKDGRLLIRFLAEIPKVSKAMLERVRRVADDPERVTIATNALLYLIMFKPPAREAAVDTAVDLWRTNEDAKSAAAKILTRWKPEVLEEGKTVKAEA